MYDDPGGENNEEIIGRTAIGFLLQSMPIKTQYGIYPPHRNGNSPSVTYTSHKSKLKRKAEGLRSEATSIRQGSQKGALCLYGWHGLCLEPLSPGAG
jgi:hypothetical protein